MAENDYTFYRKQLLQLAKEGSNTTVDLLYSLYEQLVNISAEGGAYHVCFDINEEPGRDPTYVDIYDNRESIDSLIKNAKGHDMNLCGDEGDGGH